MGHQELIQSLRKEGDDKIRLLWKETEAEADTVRADAAGKITAIREAHEERFEAASEEARDAVLSGAEKEARTIRLQAERDLSERLFSLSMHGLTELRDDTYEDTFSALAGEVPELQWERIRVSTLDMDIASRLFPGSHIEPDTDIRGGLEAVSKNGEVRIINTFEKRLERSWEEILPFMIRDVYGKRVTHEYTSEH